MKSFIKAVWPVTLMVVLAAALCQFRVSNALTVYNKLVQPVKRLATETEDQRITRQYEEIRKAENLRIEEYVQTINSLGP